MGTPVEDADIWMVQLASDSDRDSRYAICKTCTNLTDSRECSINSYVMPTMTCWQDAVCPEDKWSN